jgi:hypothetical protein
MMPWPPKLNQAYFSVSALLIFWAFQFIEPSYFFHETIDSNRSSDGFKLQSLNQSGLFVSGNILPMSGQFIMEFVIANLFNHPVLNILSI